MSHKVEYPTALEMFSYEGQKRDHSLRLCSATLFPWPENGSEGKILGHSLCAHYVRIRDLSKEIDLTHTNAALVYRTIFGHDDLFLATTQLGRERPVEVLELLQSDFVKKTGIKREIKRIYNKLSLNGFPIWALSSENSIRETGIVALLCLTDQVMLAEEEGFTIDGVYGEYLAHKWGIEKIRVLKEDARGQVNGKIGSLPEVFDISAIRESALADLWRGKVSRWKDRNLPEIVANEMDALYSPAIEQSFKFFGRK